MGFVLSPLMGIALNGVVLYLLTLTVEGISYTGGFKFFVIGGIVLGLINSLVKPFAKAISLPFIFITGGLFLIVVNIGILWFLSYLIDVIEFRDVTLSFQNAGTYVIGAIVFGIINWTFSFIIK
jgi:putative membrane protein